MIRSLRELLKEPRCGDVTTPAGAQVGFAQKSYTILEPLMADKNMAIAPEVVAGETNIQQMAWNDG